MAESSRKAPRRKWPVCTHFSQLRHFGALWGHPPPLSLHTSFMPSSQLQTREVTEGVTLGEAGTLAIKHQLLTGTHKEAKSRWKAGIPAPSLCLSPSLRLRFLLDSAGMTTIMEVYLPSLSYPASRLKTQRVIVLILQSPWVPGPAKHRRSRQSPLMMRLHPGADHLWTPDCSLLP